MGAHITGVILAAGEGRRMGVVGQSQPKACLPLLNRPLLHHHLDLLDGLKVDTVVLVVGFEGSTVEETARGHAAIATGRMGLTVVIQAERRGIAHALRCAESAIDDAMVVILADTFFAPGRPDEALGMVNSGQWPAVLSIRHEPDPRVIARECSVEYDATGQLERIVEKLAEPFNTLKPCGMYFFTSAIWEAISKTPPSALRGEVEITDAIGTMVRLGYRVGRADSVRWDMNINTPAELLVANLVALRLAGHEASIHPSVEVHPDARVVQSVIGPRVRVGQGAHLEQCLVLPGVRSTLYGSHRRCIIGDGYVLEGLFDDEALPSLNL